MAKWNLLVYALLLSQITSEDSTLNDHNLLHFAMENELGLVASEKYVLDLYSKDSTFRHKIFLLSDSINNPLLYYALIKTPVCIDEICKPLHVKIYWNLLGNYAGFGLYNDEALSKFDHEYFDKDDYQKMHNLLLNEKSILRQRKLEDLYDKSKKRKEQVTYKGVEVDAITGATKKEIKESVVEGALYSCYTLWHLVHGQAYLKMQQHLENIYSIELSTAWLYSPYADYQLFALKNLETSSYKLHQNRIIDLVKITKPSIRTYILKKIPADFWQEQAIAEKLFQLFPAIDVNTRTILIQKIEKAHDSAFEQLSHQLTNMSKNQLSMYLTKLGRSPEKMNKVLLENLVKASLNMDYQYSYLIKDYLTTNQ